MTRPPIATRRLRSGPRISMSMVRLAVEAALEQARLLREGEGAGDALDRHVEQPDEPPGLERIVGAGAPMKIWRPTATKK